MSLWMGFFDSYNDSMNGISSTCPSGEILPNSLRSNEYKKNWIIIKESAPFYRNQCSLLLGPADEL